MIDPFQYQKQRSEQLDLKRKIRNDKILKSKVQKCLPTFTIKISSSSSQPNLSTGTNTINKHHKQSQLQQTSLKFTSQLQTARFYKFDQIDPKQYCNILNNLMYFLENERNIRMFKAFLNKIDYFNREERKQSKLNRNLSFRSRNINRHSSQKLGYDFLDKTKANYLSPWKYLKKRLGPMEPLKKSGQTNRTRSKSVALLQQSHQNESLTVDKNFLSVRPQRSRKSSYSHCQQSNNQNLALSKLPLKQSVVISQQSPQQHITAQKNSSLIKFNFNNNSSKKSSLKRIEKINTLSSNILSYGNSILQKERSLIGKREGKHENLNNREFREGIDEISKIRKINYYTKLTEAQIRRKKNEEIEQEVMKRKSQRQSQRILNAKEKRQTQERNYRSTVEQSEEVRNICIATLKMFSQTDKKVQNSRLHDSTMQNSLSGVLGLSLMDHQNRSKIPSKLVMQSDKKERNDLMKKYLEQRLGLKLNSIQKEENENPENTEQSLSYR